MFAVPGWSLPAPLVQEPVRKAVSSDDIKKSQKRKRHDQSSDATPRATIQARDALLTTNVEVYRTDNPLVERSQPSKPLGKSRRQEKGFSGKYGNHEAFPKSDEKGIKSRQGTTSLQKHNRQRKSVSNASIGESRNLRQNSIEQDVEINRAVAGLSANTDNILQLPPLLTTRLTPLQAKMRNKLTSARFRHINETLYTTTSSEALDLFTKSPELFADYHAGFAQQVKDSWPQNPVQEYVKSIRARGAGTNPAQGITPLPRRKTGSCTIADLGCGDAPLARGCQSIVKSLMLKFHNYDLHAPNTFVTKADIAHLPLRDGEADITVFCLSLMGTNWITFVEEAWRILRGDGKGEVWVAEVKSRFGRMVQGRVVTNSVGKRRKISKSNDHDQDNTSDQVVEDASLADQTDDDTDLAAFIKVFTRRGFQLREGSVDKKNKMFVTMIFTKSGIPTAGKHKGMKWTGKEYVIQDSTTRMRFGKSKSGSQEDDVSIEEEAKVLKPCVYKAR